jgi:hypothetical protein
MTNFQVSAFGWYSVNLNKLTKSNFLIMWYLSGQNYFYWANQSRACYYSFLLRSKKYSSKNFSNKLVFPIKFVLATSKEKDLCMWTLNNKASSNSYFYLIFLISSKFTSFLSMMEFFTNYSLNIRGFFLTSSKRIGTIFYYWNAKAHKLSKWTLSFRIFINSSE